LDQRPVEPKRVSWGGISSDLVMKRSITLVAASAMAALLLTPHIA
jgi:hypothetical protein